MITADPDGRDVPIVDAELTADIYVDPADHAVAGIAAADFAADVERVTGRTPDVVNSTDDLGAVAVVIGTRGHSAGVETCLSESRIDGDQFRQRRESYVVETLQSPIEGVEACVLVTGSDRRGTAYGVYDLSRAMGVSPWYWWADVPAEDRDVVAVEAGVHEDGPPSVPYRGIFLNDEDFGLRPWANETHAPDDDRSGIGPATYERVFELLLRLKANTIWPAMHPGTRAFYRYDEHADLADRYAIVVGTSHCEPMHRNNVDEWDRPAETWNYATNRETIREYWRERVEAVADYENTFTLGMRGIHDSGMPGGDSPAETRRLLQAVIDDQREIIAETHDEPVDAVPQIFCPYKEVLDLYRADLDVPEDVTILWPDDNYGYLRQLPNADERERSGGHGLYYHLSYWGRPHDYLWLSSVPLGLIEHELTRAYDAGADEYWVFNVGDIKPTETEMAFALDLAWDVESARERPTADWLESWASRTFGPTHASAIADIFLEYARLAQARKPEHVAWSRVYPDTEPDDPAFSLTHGGDEARRRADAFRRIEHRASAVRQSLPDAKRDALDELVTYPVRCAASMTETHLAALRSRRYAGQGRATSDRHAALSRQAHQAIAAETRRYNETLGDGKWRDMMSHNPRDLPAFDAPATGTVDVYDGPALGVIPAGSHEPIDPDAARPPALPTFDERLDRRHFIDLFARGTDPVEWSATPSEPWIDLPDRAGTVTGDRRLWVGIDRERLPETPASGTITIEAVGVEKTVRVAVTGGDREADFVTVDGTAAMEAEHATRRVDGDRARWVDADAPGRQTGATVAVEPAIFEGYVPTDGSDASTEETPPRLAFTVEVPADDTVTVAVHCLPTQALHDGRDLRYAVSIDGSRAVVSIDPDGGEHDPEWQRNVLRGAAIGTSRHDVSAGVRTLSIAALDPGLVVDRVVLDTGDGAETYLGPRETRISG